MNLGKGLSKEAHLLNEQQVRSSSCLLSLNRFSIRKLGSSVTALVLNSSVNGGF